MRAAVLRAMDDFKTNTLDAIHSKRRVVFDMWPRNILVQTFDNNGQFSVKLWLVDLESMLDEDQECGGSFIKRVEGLETMMVATKKHDIARWNLIVAFVEANGLEPFCALAAR